MPAIPLLDLPTELHLEILSYFRIREIQQFRRIHPHFRELIDEKKNRDTLTRRSTSASITRLEKKVAELVEYDLDKEDPFLSALAAFIAHRGWHVEPRGSVDREFSLCLELEDYQAFTAHRGWHVDPRGSVNREFSLCLELEDCQMETDSFVRHWMLRTGEREYLPNESDWDLRGYREADYESIVRHLMQLHLGYHTLAKDNPVADCIIGRSYTLDLPFYAASLSPLVGLQTEDQCEDVSKRIESTPGGLFKAAVFRDNKDLPLFYLTEVRAPSYNKHDWSRREQQPFCCHETLSEILGIPVLDPCNIFAYCSETQWAYSRIKAAVKAWRPGHALTSMEKAAVLEELFIY